MTRLTSILALIAALFLLQLGCSSDWVKTQYEDYRKRTAELDTETIVAGLKQALEKGTQRGVLNLGTLDGYLKNGQVRIPVPEHLREVESLLRKIGADKYADQFIVSLNRAAEAAAPQAKEIFLDVIREMTIRDAVGILRGPDDAATQYFRRHSEVGLPRLFNPLSAARPTDSE